MEVLLLAWWQDRNWDGSHTHTHTHTLTHTHARMCTQSLSLRLLMDNWRPHEVWAGIRRNHFLPKRNLATYRARYSPHCTLLWQTFSCWMLQHRVQERRGWGALANLAPKAGWSRTGRTSPFTSLLLGSHLNPTQSDQVPSCLFSGQRENLRSEKVPITHLPSPRMEGWTQSLALQTMTYICWPPTFRPSDSFKVPQTRRQTAVANHSP
jgi:hypothetical protein